LTSINVDAANTQYSSENGVLFNKDKTTLICYPAGKTGSYVIPNSVTTIGDYAFAYCSGLTSVTIPNSVTTLGKRAFYNCNGLSSVTIPNSVTTIGDWAFESCNGLTSVTIPNSVTTVGVRAFGSCSGLTSVTIPNSVTTIGNLAFGSCSGLTDIYVDAANTQYSSENGVLFNKDKTTLVTCPGGKTGGYVIPNSVTTIGYGAFAVCEGLTSVIIGNSVTTIGNTAFIQCTGLTTVTNLNPVPQNIDSDVFIYVNLSRRTLKVPASAVEAYKAAPVWGKFGNITANE
jgi:hypothetical protein